MRFKGFSLLICAFGLTICGQAWGRAPLNAMTNAEIEEDTRAIQKIANKVVQEAIERDPRLVAGRFNRDAVNRDLNEKSFLLAKSRIWLLGLKQTVFGYPEMVVVDPIVRLIRFWVVYPALIASGHANLILLAPLVPDIEAMDGLYFLVRRKVDHWLFKKRYGYEVSEIDRFRMDLLAQMNLTAHQPMLAAALGAHEGIVEDLQSQIHDPITLTNILESSPSQSAYRAALQAVISEDRDFKMDVSMLSQELQMLLQMEVTLVRTELVIQKVQPPKKITDALVPRWRRPVYRQVEEELNVEIAQLKELEKRYLAFLLSQKKSPESSLAVDSAVAGFAKEFIGYRTHILRLLPEYETSTQEYRRQMHKPLLCSELLIH